jgi:GNAT superfamily N-acetyltransferase
MSFAIRKAELADVEALRSLIELSVRRLQAVHYTPDQLERGLQLVYGVDTQLIEDGTYFVVQSASVMVGCGGWSRRKTLYGGDQWAAREDALLQPGRDAAKIRAFFVHPDWVRRGVASLILDACEAAAKQAGFTRLEMGSTLTGVALYRARGYAELESLTVPLGDGEGLPIVRMAKAI